MNFKILALTALFIALPAMACDKPAPPPLPDPHTAVTAQMIKAKNQMKAFIAAAESYLNCIESDTSSYNAMIDDMENAADSFNRIVRKYKKRMAEA